MRETEEEGIVDQVAKDRYAKAILEILNENPDGSSCEPLWKKIQKKGKGFGDRSHFFLKLNWLNENGLISKEPDPQPDRLHLLCVRITEKGRLFLSRIRNSKDIVNREYRFNVGEEGFCKVSLFLPQIPLAVSSNLLDYLGEAIEGVADELLKRSNSILHESERFHAWAIIDLNTDRVSDEIINFREKLLELQEEMNDLRYLWELGSLRYSKEKSLGPYFFGTLLFEVALVRLPLEDRGLNTSLLCDVSRAKTSILKRSELDCYRPNFKFMVNDQIVDLSEDEMVASFYSELQNSEIREWIEWNLKMDRGETWFEDIPWHKFNIYVNDIMNYEFVEADFHDNPRYLLASRPIDYSIPDSYLRMQFHILKRVPSNTENEHFLRVSSEVEVTTDFMFMETYQIVKDELGLSTLPPDLERFVKSKIARWNGFGIHTGLGVAMLRPTYEALLREKPEYNPLVDRYMKSKLSEWESADKRKYRRTHTIERTLRKIGEEYFRLIRDGFDESESLEKAVDRYIDIQNFV